MEELKRKYAHFLITDCLNLKNGQPLLVSGNLCNKEFIQIVKEEAIKLGSGPISTIMLDRFEERELFLHHTYEECIESPLLDRSLYNEIALKGGAFLSLSSPIPHIYDGIDVKKLGKLSLEMEKRISIFREYQMKGTLPWCIAGVPNSYWAKEILPNEENPEEKLWEIILNICLIPEENPSLLWKEYFETMSKRCQILNDAKIRSLHYKSANGTDITFELPKDYLFVSAKDSDFIANMPSLEIFTTPYKTGVNGIVYSSKPLYHSGVKIDDFYLRFENGRIVEASAKENNDMLEQIIKTDEGSHYLGEIALVDFDSRINQSNILFQNTLFDENACCHLAIGKGFSECFVNGQSKSLEELKSLGMNDSAKHVDFMIGTRDLEIVATLSNGDKMKIMEQGKMII